MKNLYVAWYMCKRIHGLGVPLCNDITLGLYNDNEKDIIIKGTCSEFVVGKEYLITVGEKEKE